MSNWAYVAIAYTLVWGSLAAYALLLSRRVTQACEVAKILQESVESGRPLHDQDGVACDAPPAP
ncbi:MAG: hypothetical protein NVSMB52_01480 [Chloroflexota bacterium]